MAVIIALLLYELVYIAEIVIVGACFGFLLSNRETLVGYKTLFLTLLAYAIVYQVLILVIVAPLELSLTTSSPTLVRFFGTSDFSYLFEFSWSLSDIGLTLLEVGIGTGLGRWLVASSYRYWATRLPSSENG